MEQYAELRKKLEDTIAAAGPDQAVDISDILNSRVRRAPMPKTDKGAKKVVMGSNLISNNYDAVEFAGKLLGRREYATAFAKAHGKGAQVKTPGQVKETQGRSLIDAVAKAEAEGKLVDVSALVVVQSGSGDKMKEKVQGYRTVAADKFGAGYKGNKKFVAALPNVISNNYEAYALAAEELGVGYAAQQFYDQHPTLRGGKPAKRSPVAKKEKVAKRVVKSPKQGGDPGDWLAHMYEQAQTKKAYLDVSMLKPDGTGAKLIPKMYVGKDGQQKQKNLITKVGAGREMHIVSNNYANYALATGLLGGEFSRFADDWAAQHGLGKVVRPAAKEKASPKTKRVAGAIDYQRSASRSPVRSASRSPVRSAGRSASPAVRRLSQERAATRSRERMMAEEMMAERSLERSLERARSASRSASRSPVRSVGRSASPQAAPRIPVPRRTMATQSRVNI